MSTSPSYRKSDCCGGADCWFLDWDPDEPCWGKVEVEVSGDGDVFHACRGHRDTLNLSSLAPGLLEYYREPRCNPMLEVTKVVPCPECS